MSSLSGKEGLLSLCAQRVARHFSSRKKRKVGIVGITNMIPYISVMSLQVISRNAFLTTIITGNVIHKGSEE